VGDSEGFQVVGYGGGIIKGEFGMKLQAVARRRRARHICFDAVIREFRKAGAGRITGIEGWMGSTLRNKWTYFRCYSHIRTRGFPEIGSHSGAAEKPKLADHFHPAVGGYAIASDAGGRCVIVLGLDDENVTRGIILRVAADSRKRAIAAVYISRKCLVHWGDECNGVKIPLAIWICAALTLDIGIGRKPVREDHEVPRNFRENRCIPDIASSLLPDLFIA
jgi:hypothetical protein